MNKLALQALVEAAEAAKAVQNSILRAVSELEASEFPAFLHNTATGETTQVNTSSDSVRGLNQVSAAPHPATRPIPWGAAVTGRFIDSLLWIEDQIGLKPEVLMPCMKFESNLNPAAKNPASSGTGLIQFMRTTALRLGTTVEQLVQMSPEVQLGYVFKYFKEYDDRGFKLESWDVSDCYMAILWPAGIGKPNDYRVFDSAKGGNYAPNRGLDTNKDGVVSRKEACERVVKLERQGYESGNVRYI